MYIMRSVGVLSCAKIMGAIYGCLGLLFIPFLLLGGFISMLSGKGSDAIPAIATIVLCILAPAFYGALGFAMGAFSAWIYNIFANWLGGLRIELQVEVANPPMTLNVS